LVFCDLMVVPLLWRFIHSLLKSFITSFTHYNSPHLHASHKTIYPFNAALCPLNRLSRAGGSLLLCNAMHSQHLCSAHYSCNLLKEAYRNGHVSVAIGAEGHAASLLDIELSIQVPACVFSTHYENLGSIHIQTKHDRFNHSRRSSSKFGESSRTGPRFSSRFLLNPL